jgi:CMP-N,N'-diacetyllegionaminic acid synthase
VKSLGVLCARGASKRLPRKHLRLLLGIPLVAWMCRAAAASTLTRVVLSTEDEDIAAVGQAHGAETPFRRPAPLAEDYAADYDIVVDALDRCEAEDGYHYDMVVMLQPTTPFTQPDDIDGCISKLAADPGLATCFTARPVREPPQWMFSEGADGRALPLFEEIGRNAVAHKQLLPSLWLPNGAAYAVRVDAFRAQRKIYCTPFAFYPMDADRSIDIDDQADLIVAEGLGRMRGFSPAAPARNRHPSIA